MMGWGSQAARKPIKAIKAFLSVKKAKLTCRFQMPTSYFDEK